MALINLRDTATQKGLKVDWSPDSGAMINGNPVDTGGLINYGNAAPEGMSPNTFYGTQEQIDKILSPYLTMPPPGGTTPAASSGGLVSLRDIATQKGLNVAWDSKLGAMINGTPVNTSGLTNYGQAPPPGYQADTLYGTPEQINQILSPYVVPQVGAPVQEANKKYQDWANTDYQAKYAPELEAIVKNVLTRQFNYDPANDAQFQAAAKELTRNVMESMNARGILNSTITQNQVQQGIANLMPEYERIARQNFQNEGEVLMSQVDMLLGLDEQNYNRFQDEGQRYAKALDAVMQMDNEQYDRWKEAANQRYTLSKDRIEAEEKAVESKQKAIDDAWDRVEYLGYADNEAAIVLGIAPGTLSKSAREYYQKREAELSDMKTKHEQQLAEIEAQRQKEISVIEAKGEDGTSPEKTMTLKEVDDMAASMRSIGQTAPEIGELILFQMGYAGYDDTAIRAMLKIHGIVYDEKTGLFSYIGE